MRQDAEIDRTFTLSPTKRVYAYNTTGILKAFKLKYVPPLSIYIDNLTLAVLFLFVCDRYTAHMRF